MTSGWTGLKQAAWGPTWNCWSTVHQSEITSLAQPLELIVKRLVEKSSGEAKALFGDILQMFAVED